MAGPLKKVGTTKVDRNGEVVDVGLYEKTLISKVVVTKEYLLNRKAELEQELVQINLDLSQVNLDEQGG